MAASTVSTPYRSSNWVSRLLADAERAELRADVADPLLGDTDVVQHDVDDVLANLAAPDELDRRQAQPLLHDLGRGRGKAARHHAAGIRPMAGIRQVAPEAVAVIERPHHLDVHQVGAAEIGVVDQDDVTRIEVAAPLDHRLGGELHHPDKDRQTELALGDDFAGRAIVDAVGAVESFGDDRRERGFLVDQVHLAGHLAQAVLDHRQRHRIERHVSPTEITRLPKPSTMAVAPGSMTTVVSGCSTIAGPASIAPLPREARSKIAVSNQPPLKRTCRAPLGLRCAGDVNGGGKNRQIDRGAPPDHGGAQIHQHRRHLRQLDVEPRLVALDEIDQHGVGVKTRGRYRHPEYMALTAEQEVDFVANHDFRQRHSFFVKKPPSRRGLIGEAAVDLAVAASASG